MDTHTSRTAASFELGNLAKGGSIYGRYRVRLNMGEPVDDDVNIGQCYRSADNWLDYFCSRLRFYKITIFVLRGKKKANSDPDISVRLVSGPSALVLWL